MDSINTGGGMLGMEPNRVPGITLFKYHLLDWTLYAIATCLYIPCNIFFGEKNLIIFYTIYSLLLSLALYLIEDYREFVKVRRYVNLLERDDSLCAQYFATMLYPEDITTIIPPNMPPNGEIYKEDDEIEAETKLNHKGPRLGQEPKDKATDDTTEKTRVKFPSDAYDNFNWINMIIVFFWPTVSEIIHHQLDQFFHNEIQSGHFAHSENKSIRFLYSIWNQFNIIAIEKFQLGHQTPAFKSIKVKAYNGKPIVDIKNKDNKQKNLEVKGKSNYTESREKSINNVKIGDRVDLLGTQKSGKMLRLDVDIEYIGDMKLSLLYRNLCCFNSRIGLKRAFLKFKFRILLGPITTKSPFIEQISFNLRELPDYGYQGIALVELAELRLARRLINNVIRENLLEPHAIIITAEDVRKKLEESETKKKSIESSKEAAQKEIDNTDSTTLNATKQINTIPKSWTPTTSSRNELSCISRFGARVAIYTCFCVNCCLKSCQKRKAPMVVSSSDLGPTRSPSAIAREDHLKSIL